MLATVGRGILVKFHKFNTVHFAPIPCKSCVQHILFVWRLRFPGSPKFDFRTVLYYGLLARLISRLGNLLRPRRPSK